MTRRCRVSEPASMRGRIAPPAIESVSVCRRVVEVDARRKPQVLWAKFKLGGVASNPCRQPARCAEVGLGPVEPSRCRQYGPEFFLEPRTQLDHGVLRIHVLGAAIFAEFA